MKISHSDITVHNQLRQTTVLPGHNDFPMTLGKEDKRVGALILSTPNRLNKGESEGLVSKIKFMFLSLIQYRIAFRPPASE